MSVLFTVETFTSADNTSLRFAKMISQGESANNQCPVVFVPGLGGSVKGAISFLEQFVPEHGPVYSLDARGFGLNESVAPKPHPASYLKDLDRFIHYLQEQNMIHSEQNPIIMGLSLGGIYATLYTTQHNHPFKGKILIAPAFRPHPSLFDAAFKFKNYSKILFQGPFAKTTLPYGVRELTRNAEAHENPDFQAPLVLPSFYLFLVEMICNKALALSRNITLPTAVVVPQQDLVCDPQAMISAFERIQHPRKQIFTYPQLYHDVMQEPWADQRQVYNDLKRWIAGMYQPEGI